MAEYSTHPAGSVETAAPDPTAPPDNPPGYELLDEIGRGGMGVVYRARDTAFDRDVAVKLLSERYPPDSHSAQRFLSEARITGQLQHPGIPAIHQVGVLADGRPFLAMKLIKGSTLEVTLKQMWDGFEIRPTPSADRGRLLAIFEAVCQAVGYAHAHRVIHRDLKPANVMVGAFGEVQVMDWGLAKVLGEETPTTAEAMAAEQTRAWTQFSPTPEAGSHTQAGSLVGTPAFIAPEQALGEIEKVNERSDVFGLGALLAVILTGKPPYVGETGEAVRVQAVRGKLADCFARLDASGAEPELVALCKKCLAFEPADRPADAGAVAQAVAGLRAAADERARRAELERVRVEGEQATAAARSAERRKRRRLVIGAAAVLVVAAVGGLAAVLAVQRRANADLAAKNTELADEQAKVEARFELAQKAIALFHTGVSEDMLLKNAKFKDLRTKLLKEAKGFYEDLEKLLAGQTDARSRKALAAAYFQLGELTAKIGDQKEALTVHRKGLSLRRELAAEEGANAETRLDVARSLRAEGLALFALGDFAAALRVSEEQRNIATALEAEFTTDAVRVVRAQSHNTIGNVYYETGKLPEALQSHRQVLAIRQKLVDANSGVTEFQLDLAKSHYNIHAVLFAMRKDEESLLAAREALRILRKLAEANPTAFEFQRSLARTYIGIGNVLGHMGKSEEALQAYQEELAINEKLCDAIPAVTEFQRDLGWSYNCVGSVQALMGKPAEGLLATRKALAILQKLTDANPGVIGFEYRLASISNSLGMLMSLTGEHAEALLACGKALAIIQKLAEVNPAVTEFKYQLAWTHNTLGRVLARQQRFAEALAAFDAALAIHPDAPDTHAYRGWARIRSRSAGCGSKAAADLRRALEAWAKEHVLDTATRFERARALALLAGLAADVKSGVTKDEAAAFADQAVAALRDAISAGWGLTKELKEPDFDAIRGRDDFKKLVADREAKAGPKAKTKH